MSNVLSVYLTKGGEFSKYQFDFKMSKQLIKFGKRIGVQHYTSCYSSVMVSTRSNWECGIVAINPVNPSLLLSENTATFAIHND